MWIRTKAEPHWYIHEIRGACYVSWVSQKDRDQALTFPQVSVETWVRVLSEMSHFELEFIRPYV